MTGGDLSKVEFLGRPIKPLAFAIMLSVATVFWFNIVLNGDILVDTFWGDIVGVAAGASCVLLFAGWWARSQRLAEYGLVLASGTWMARLFTVIFLQGWGFYGVYLSIAWTLACVGAYLLETFDGGRAMTAQRKAAES